LTLHIKNESRFIRKRIMRLTLVAAAAGVMLAAAFSYPCEAQTTAPDASAPDATAPDATGPDATAPSTPAHGKPPKKTPHASAAASPVQIAIRTDQQPTAAGFWAQVGDDGKVGGWFFFEKHDGLYDGRLVKMFKQPGDTHHFSDVCEKCEGDEKNAPMLGLTIVKGMHRDGNKYEDGSILDPRDGTIYHAQMEVSADGHKLFVRGYLGIPLLGQTQTWQRLPDNSIAAADIPPPSKGPDAAAQ
jgi:uncharacterized protein (DUF2147 family)